MSPKKSSGTSENQKNKSATAAQKSVAADLTKKTKVPPKGSGKGSAGSAKKAPSKSAKSKPEKAFEKEKPESKAMAAFKKSVSDVKDEPKKQNEDGAISCKTPQVMKLVAENDEENTVIAAGKSRIPARQKGKEPLSKTVKRELRGDFLEPNEVEVVNLTELAVQYEAPQILDRFNACSCEKCVEVFSEMVLNKVPARFARITKTKLGIRSRELSGRVEPVREMVQITMIRELIRSKKRIFHDE